MPLAGPFLALALAACSSPGEADAALAHLEALAPDADLRAAESVLAACGPAASTPELRVGAEADRAAVRRVIEAERRASLIYPAGGKTRAQADLEAAASEVARRADLVARLSADGRAMERIRRRPGRGGGREMGCGGPARRDGAGRFRRSAAWVAARRCRRWSGRRGGCVWRRARGSRLVARPARWPGSWACSRRRRRCWAWCASSPAMGGRPPPATTSRCTTARPSAPRWRCSCWESSGACGPAPASPPSRPASWAAWRWCAGRPSTSSSRRWPPGSTRAPPSPSASSRCRCATCGWGSPASPSRRATSGAAP